MHDQEIIYFREALELLRNDFFVDAIHKFEELVKYFPDSDLADDALYNIALCYFEMNSFEKAKEVLASLIEKYPDATISALTDGSEFGRTAAKAYYLTINCCLALGQIARANELLPIVKKYDDTYTVKNGVKKSFYELSAKAIDVYKSININTRRI